MPIHCPLNFSGICDIGSPCRKYDEGKCTWFFPPSPIADILTEEERLSRLESKLNDLEADMLRVIPSKILAHMRSKIGEIKAELRYNINKLNDHLDLSRKEVKKKKTITSKGVSIG